MGALVAARVPRNAIGWIFLAIPLGGALAGVTENLAFQGLYHDPGSVPGALAFGWVYAWVWYPTVGLLGFVLLLYPTGSVPGPRWRPVAWALGIVLAVMTLGYMLYPGPLDKDTRLPDNPLGIASLKSVFDHSDRAAAVSMVGLVVAALLSVIVRFRRSRGDERQQMKWMAFAAAVLAAGFVVQSALDLGDISFAIAISTLPVALGIAMFKYRLYDVDRVINKTLVYGARHALLGGAYVGLVLAGEAVFASLARGSSVAVALSTLVVARRCSCRFATRVQRFVDRRFYRSKIDAEEMLAAVRRAAPREADLDALPGRCSPRSSHDALHRRWSRSGSVTIPRRSPVERRCDERLAAVDSRVIRRTERPAALAERRSPREPACAPASSRLRSSRSRRTTRSSRTSRARPGAVDLDGLELESPALEELRAAGVRLAVPLVSQGELVGLLNLGPRLSDQDYSTDDRKLLNSLAAQAAPALQVAQLVRRQEAEARSRERIEQELRVATLIQQNFLPKKLPDLPGWQVSAYYRPAREVGGDFYDFIELPGRPDRPRDRRRHRQGRPGRDGHGRDAERAARLRAARRLAGRGARARQRPHVPRHAGEDVRHLPLRRPRAVDRPLPLRERRPQPPVRPHRRGHDRAARDGHAARAAPRHRVRGDGGDPRARPGDAAPLRRRRRGALGPRRRCSASRACSTWSARGRTSGEVIDRVLTELGRFTPQGWEQEDDITLVSLTPRRRRLARRAVRLPRRRVHDPERARATSAARASELPKRSRRSASSRRGSSASRRPSPKRR